MTTAIRARSAAALAVLGVSAAALIATSKSPASAYVNEVAVEDFSLSPGQSRQYTAEITHTDLGDETGTTFVNVRASAFSVDSDTDLTVSVSDGDDTGGTSSGEDRQDVDAGGVTLFVSQTFPLDTSPTIILTAGSEGGIEGTLTVDVGVEWYAEPSEQLSVTVELVELSGD